jgi:hypothetical protein
MLKRNENVIASHAVLSFDHTTGSGGEAIYTLSGTSLHGFLSGEFAIKYNPSLVSVVNGEISTDIPGAALKSRVETTANQFRVAVMTSDDIDADDRIPLLRIVLPPIEFPASAVWLEKVLINEGAITTNYPADGLRNENSINVIKVSDIPLKNRLSVDMGGLTIWNPERLQVSVNIYDLRGRMVYDRNFESTTGIIRVDSQKFTAGIYVCRMKMGGKVKSLPMAVGR